MKNRLTALHQLCKENESPFSDSLSTTGKSTHKEPNYLFCRHVGLSMNPTLHNLDLLEIVPYGKRPVQVGDIVVFLPPERRHVVVHRAVHVTLEGIRTRGDNNTCEDPWQLAPSDITGKVIYAWHGRKRRRIAGGLSGWLQSLLNRFMRSLVPRTSFVMGPIYRFLASYGNMHHFVPELLKPRVISIRNGSCNSLRLLMGRQVVGRYDTIRGQWIIKKPFHLFLDKASLPKSLS